MKKVKDPAQKRLTKLRSALRGVWQYDYARKAIVDAAVKAHPAQSPGYFMCGICNRGWPKEMATVDHHPPIGSFTMETIGEWIDKLFNGPQRAICKLCHKKVTAAQRRKK